MRTFDADEQAFMRMPMGLDIAYPSAEYDGAMSLAMRGLVVIEDTGDGNVANRTPLCWMLWRALSGGT